MDSRLNRECRPSPERLEAFLRKLRADAVEQGLMSREYAQAEGERGISEINRRHRETGVQHGARGLSDERPS